ncbi:MAG TPA: DegQ family serine endoprotease [Bryobacteraceae bacterium]|nr:DegQ family serine endoprotease [Bryobacteraceae bacterium]
MPSGSVSPAGPVLSYADVVDHVAPAVVTIHASRRVRAPQQFPFFDDPFFRNFFGGGVPQSRGPQTEVQHALGSGVIVRADGHILTNHHVIDGAQDIKVDLNSGRTYSAKVVGSDAASDLAVLKIDASGLPLLQLADSDKVRVGDVCLAVGNPLGVGESVTAGIISAKGRSTETVGGGSFQDFLQTDAPINQGNSGGALVNTRGELIGINSQILSSNGGNIGIGFAIPSNMARNVMNQLIGKGKVQRGMLGIGIQQVTSDIASGLGLKQVRGVLVNSVNPGGPADRGGVKTGDVIVKLNGKEVTDANKLRNEVAGLMPGTVVTLSMVRDGKPLDVRVTLGELTPESARANQQSSGGDEGAEKLGISVSALTPNRAAQLGLRRGTQGVLIDEVDPNGPAAQAGIQPGDVVQEVNRQPVRTPADVRDALAKGGSRTPVLLINRGGQSIFVPVPVQ